MKQANTLTLYVIKHSVRIITEHNSHYISLTDIAKSKNADDPRYIVQNWMRSKSTLNFLGLWEKINNTSFNRIEFDAVRSEAGINSFSITPYRWIKLTNSVGIVSKLGKYGGTFAHQDIAFEFASWISPEFKLYLIKEFQRLKQNEISTSKSDWDLKRNLAAINYKIHTAAVQNHLIPQLLTSNQISSTYASEADLLNVALFGMTAKEWRRSYPELNGNIRDFATSSQLVCLSNLESLNAELIVEGLSQQDRLKRLNTTAIRQMKILADDTTKKIAYSK